MTDYCSQCECIGGDNVTNVLVTNGFCDDESNNADCNYDGGDCCGSCIDTDYCSQCACLGEIIGNGIPNALVGDGFCNDKTNIADCDYDGGDCCGSCVLNTQCIECACLGGSDIINALIGYGFCNEETYMLNVPMMVETAVSPNKCYEIINILQSN